MVGPPGSYAIEVPDRVRKERYYDPDFYAMEAELIWPRVWQMACRLEEIPEAGDFAEYLILDQSVIVIRTEDLGVPGIPERVPPPWCPRRPGPRFAPRRLRVPLPRLVLRPGRAQHASDPARRVLRAQSRGRPTSI